MLVLVELGNQPIFRVQLLGVKDTPKLYTSTTTL